MEVVDSRSLYWYCARGRQRSVRIGNRNSNPEISIELAEKGLSGLKGSNDRIGTQNQSALILWPDGESWERRNASNEQGR